MIDDIDLDEILALIGEPKDAPAPSEEVPPVKPKAITAEAAKAPQRSRRNTKSSDDVAEEHRPERTHSRSAGFERRVPQENVHQRAVRKAVSDEKIRAVSENEPAVHSGKAEKRQALPADWKISIPFFSVILTLMVVSFIIPLRPDKSIRERRSLAGFPDFSVSSLVSGEYFGGISDWFSDTFPGRESWIDVSDKITGLHGISTIAFNFSGAPTSPASDQQGTQDSSAEASENSSADNELSSSEPVEVMPADDYSEEELLEISSDDEIIEWGGLQNNEAAEVVLGNVIQIDDSCYNYFTFSDEYSNVHAEIANDIGSILEGKGVRFFDILVPDSLGILYTPEFVEKLGCANYEQALDYVYGLENDNVIKVNLYNTLVSRSDEYIYFRTDHHWTALGAYYAYTKWCEMAGFEPVSLDKYTEIDMGTYHGSFYAKAPDSSKLTDDNLVGYVPPGDLMTVIDSGDGKYVADAVRDMSNSQVTYKYQAFICGDNPLTVITNNDLPDAPNCLIIQDSFGNPFCVYLAQHYHKVYIVDYREGYLTFSRFVDSYDISDVIIEEYLGFIQGSDTNYLFRQMAK